MCYAGEGFRDLTIVEPGVLCSLKYCSFQNLILSNLNFFVYINLYEFFFLEIKLIDRYARGHYTLQRPQNLSSLKKTIDIEKRRRRENKVS